MKLADLTEPSALKHCSIPELRQLATEIRDILLDVLCDSGGHLASNLGVVELTVALHSILNSPTDKILWDVSHQSYPHKLLTNRAGRFSTVRQHGGLAGYTDPRESKHDHFHWGHAGTALSAAVGLAKARDLLRESYRVVAVVGDGALTSGLTYEALNHAGEQKLRLTMILNDNAMSISPNVGALNQYLGRLRSKQGHATTLFQELGWEYHGPVDGHDMGALRDALLDAVSREGPSVVHVLTVKGKGYAPAEACPRTFHGTGPFQRETGTRVPGSAVPTYSEVFARTLTDMANQDERIVAVTAAMLDGTGLARMAGEHPGRVLDVGIAEQHAVSLCAGLAKGGLRPVLAIYSTFLQRGYDQIIHDVALQNLPVVCAVDRAGLVEDGASHHGLYDIAYLRCIPNVVIMSPKDEQELQHMIYTALQLPGPSAIRYPRSAGLGLTLDSRWNLLPVGKGEMIMPGTDVAIAALGSMVAPSVKAAALLADRGVSACVLNARFAKPLDEDLIQQWAHRTGLIVTVEEGVVHGGFGSAVAELLGGEAGGCSLVQLGVPDRFIGHGNPQRHRTELGLDPAGIAASCMTALGRRRTLRSGVAIASLAAPTTTPTCRPPE